MVMNKVEFSICIPHYNNRSQFLLAVLESVSSQDYSDVEVIISDDCSTDDSEHVIPLYIEKQKSQHNLVEFRYIRQQKNLGYDDNLRASMEAATVYYLFLIGNDDALATNKTLSQLAIVLRGLEYPDIAFANFHLLGNPKEVVRRAKKTAVLGSGLETAVKYFRSFSFVGSVIVKQSSFRQHNTDKYDGSIYSQIYLTARITAFGGKLASISESLVAKDVQIPGTTANSYLDVLAKDNHHLVPKTGGLDQVGRVAGDAILPELPSNKKWYYTLLIYSQLLSFTYSYWLLDYRRNGVYRASVNLTLGCFPLNLTKFQKISLFRHICLLGLYAVITTVSLITSVFLVNQVQQIVYPLVRRA